MSIYGNDLVITFGAAYKVLGQGRSFVRIHRLREYLDWPIAQFDGVLYLLACNGTIELHGGDTSKLSKKELADSFCDGGTVYVCLSWRSA